MHVHYMTTPEDKNPCSGSNSIYNFGRLFFGHNYFTLNLSDLCLSEEKKILKEIMHTFGHALVQVVKFTILVDHSLDIITKPSVGLIFAWE